MTNIRFIRSRNQYQNAAKCKTFLVEMCFICMRIKIFFFMNNYINNLALSLDLRQRLGQFENTRSLIRVPKGGSLKPWSPEISAVEPGALPFY